MCFQFHRVLNHGVWRLLNARALPAKDFNMAGFPTVVRCNSGIHRAPMLDEPAVTEATILHFKDSNGMTLLHHAVRVGCWEVAVKLTNLNTSPTGRPQQWTPLMVCVDVGKTSMDEGTYKFMLSHLLEHSALTTVECRSGNRSTVLHHACCLMTSPAEMQRRRSRQSDRKCGLCRSSGKSSFLSEWIFMSYCQTVDDHYFEICRNIDVRDARKTLGSDMAPTKRDVASHCVWALEATNDPLGCHQTWPGKWWYDDGVMEMNGLEWIVMEY